MEIRLDLQIQDLIETIDLLASKYQIERAVLVGWSFGGAVVISAGAQHRLVKAIGKYRHF
jgi:dienelactone hydrolase